MTTIDELAVIEARIRDCQSYKFGMFNADKLAHEDAPALLALVQKQQAVIEQIEALHVEDGNGNCVVCWDFNSDVDVKYPCPTIAVLTTTEGV